MAMSDCLLLQRPLYKETQNFQLVQSVENIILPKISLWFPPLQSVARSQETDLTNTTVATNLCQKLIQKSNETSS